MHSLARDPIHKINLASYYNKYLTITLKSLIHPYIQPVTKCEGDSLINNWQKHLINSFILKATNKDAIFFGYFLGKKLQIP